MRTQGFGVRYSLMYLFSLVLLMVGAYGAFRLAGRTSIQIDALLSDGSVVGVLNAVAGGLMVVFFMLLMVRHLVIFSLAAVDVFLSGRNIGTGSHGGLWSGDGAGSGGDSGDRSDRSDGEAGVECGENHASLIGVAKDCCSGGTEQTPNCPALDIISGSALSPALVQTPASDLASGPITTLPTTVMSNVPTADEAGSASGVADPSRWNREPMVSIIVPAYNEELCIQATIRSLLKVDYSNYEVIVVDDGSTDETLKRASMMQGYHQGVLVQVISTPNGGKCMALNMGIAHASGEFIAVIDSDSTVAPDTFSAAVPWFRDPWIGAVAGRVEVLNKVNLLSRLQHLEYARGLNLHRRAQGFVSMVGIVPGPIGIFRRKALEDVGGYDCDTYAEDCDLTVKLLLAGWKIKYEPMAVSNTEVPEELFPLIKQRYRWNRGLLQVLRKYRKYLFASRGNPAGLITLWYLVLETLALPLFNSTWLLLFTLTLFSGVLQSIALGMWLQLIILDMATTIFCLGSGSYAISAALYVPVERWIYQSLLDTIRFLASIEEFAGVKMSWGKLIRKGRAL